MYASIISTATDPSLRQPAVSSKMTLESRSTSNTLTRRMQMDNFSLRLAKLPLDQFCRCFCIDIQIAKRISDAVISTNYKHASREF